MYRTLVRIGIPLTFVIGISVIFPAYFGIFPAMNTRISICTVANTSYTTEPCLTDIWEVTECNNWNISMYIITTRQSCSLQHNCEIADIYCNDQLRIYTVGINVPCFFSSTTSCGWLPDLYRMRVGFALGITFTVIISILFFLSLSLTLYFYHKYLIENFI